MTMSINGTNGLTFNDASTQNTAATGFGFKNRIINGAMVIDQRNSGAAVTPTNGAYTVDRWKFELSQASKLTCQQTNTGPLGLYNFLNVTSLSAYTVGAGDVFRLVQAVEAFNTSDFQWGTASAKTVALSFSLYSSLTGTFGGAICNSASNRSYPFSYSVPVANTWTAITLTIPGDTSGTWVSGTNGIGLQVRFSLGAGTTSSGTAGAWAAADYTSVTGAVSVVGTSGASFYITGVQLEKGSTATTFDYRSYGTELALCQRYLPALNNFTSVDQIGVGYSYTTTSALISVNYTVTARVPPTGVSITNPTNITIGNGAGAQTAASAGGFIYGGLNQTMVAFTTTGLTLGQGCYARSTGGYQILFTGCEL